jgi:hypothetical protein
MPQTRKSRRIQGLPAKYGVLDNVQRSPKKSQLIKRKIPDAPRVSKSKKNSVQRNIANDF